VRALYRLRNVHHEEEHLGRMIESERRGSGREWRAEDGLDDRDGQGGCQAGRDARRGCRLRCWRGRQLGLRGEMVMRLVDGLFR